MGCLLFRDVLTEQKTYHPEAIGEALKKRSANYFSDDRHRIELVIREIKPTGKGAVSNEK